MIHPKQIAPVRRAYAVPEQEVIYYQRVVSETRCGRVAITRWDDWLHGFEPRLVLRIVAIPHTDQRVTVLREQLLGAFLRWKRVRIVRACVSRAPRSRTASLAPSMLHGAAAYTRRRLCRRATIPASPRRGSEDR